ncbi:hypothetical protein GJAV_G00213310 [Gymnothorax javanicus]|nr:hypothetical protein GJAV_G00213310 [Gymnothorax javanicus]
METGTAEAGGSIEDMTGKKKSKLKVLKSRLFGKMKSKETEGLRKQSQSASDVTAGKAEERADDDSADEIVHSRSKLGSRAMSHDSIFLADEGQATELVRVQSQENVHGKIRALQMKLQQQNLRLGPSALSLPGKRAEDAGVNSEDDGLPNSPPDISLSLPEGEGTSKFPDTHRNLSSLSLAGTGSEEEEQGSSEPPSRPLSPRTKPNPSTTTAATLGADFDGPAQFTPCLDSSAARHRLSVKPRNQRASAKGRRLPSSSSRPRSESLNALDDGLAEKDEEEEGEVSKDAVRFRSHSTQVIRSGDGGVQRDPMVGKMGQSVEVFEMELTDSDSRDLSSSQMPSVDSQELEGQVEPAHNSHDQQQPSEAKQLLAHSPTPGRSLAGTLSVSRNSLPGSPKRSVQEPIQPQTSPEIQPVPTPEAAALPCTSPRTSSLKRNVTEQTQQECLNPKPSESVPTPSAGLEHQPPPVGVNNGKHQRPNSGSFRFSIASAWERPRGDSLRGREEKGGATGSSDSQEVQACKPEEPKPKSQSPSAASGSKTEGNVLSKTSFFSRREEPIVAPSEETKPRDQSRNMARFQGRTNPTAKGKDSTATSSPTWVTGNKGVDPRVKPVAVETVASGAEEGKDLKQTCSKPSEEQSEGEKEERGVFGVRLRSTSQSTKSRQKEVPNLDLKSQTLRAEGNPPSKPQDPQSSSLSRVRSTQSCLVGQSRDHQGGPLNQSSDPKGNPLDQSRDPQALTPTKCPDSLQQHSMVAPGSQSQRQETDDKVTASVHSCLKPSLHRTRTSSNSDPPASPAGPSTTRSSSTKSDLTDRERLRDAKFGDVELPSDPLSDTGPALKTVTAPPKEAEPVVSEPAWKTAAREKTRSRQQMFTSKLPREFTAAAPSSKPTPNPSLPSPSPGPAPQPAPQHPPQTTPSGRGDKAQPGAAERGSLSERWAAQSEKKKIEKTSLPESTVPSADKKPGRTDRSFSSGAKTEPKSATTETHSTAATPPHKAETRTEGKATCKVHASEGTPGSAPAESKAREDKQPTRPEPSSAAPVGSGGGQPSWMELAKRKSRAWSDKTLD